MDKAPCHNGIPEWFPEREIRYLPRHSPFLNPTEKCFSAIKIRLKHTLDDILDGCDVVAAQRAGISPRAYRERLLIQSMKTSVEVVTRQLTSSQYRHSNSFLMKCLSKENIWD